jgi:hypothetical protein
MHENQSDTKRNHLPVWQQWTAVLVLALLMITGIYFLYGIWGWTVIVVSLVIISVTGMITLEIAAGRESDDKEGRVKAISHEHQPSGNTAGKAPAHDTVEPLKTVSGSKSSPASASYYRLEIVNPGKEPVKIMRLLHNELGFPAEQAKQFISSRQFPMTLAQGSKEELQEKAKKLLKGGAKLRLVTYEAENPVSASADADKQAV